MRLISTTYLELASQPEGSPLIAPIDCVRVAAERPAYTDYMRLWRSIGDPLDWDGRRFTPSVEVEATLQSPSTEIFIGRFRGEAFGLCEFIQTESLGSEIVYFGLSPKFQGRHLGPYLLDVSVREHWKINAPHRIWLHTDTSDDPKALPLYERMGFRIFARVDLPDTTTEQEYRSVARTLAQS